MTLWHRQNENIDLSGLGIEVDISGRVQSLRLARKEVAEYEYDREYEYVSDLRCGAALEPDERTHRAKGG